MIPGLKNLLLQHDLRYSILRRPVIQIPQTQVPVLVALDRRSKFPCLVTHLFGGVGPPFGVLLLVHVDAGELFFEGSFVGEFREVADDHPTAC